MNCSHCKEAKKIIARGLCCACYTRQIRGSVERVKMANKGKICRDQSCIMPAQIKGFCMTHYHRKGQHPLKTTWKLIRSRATKNANPGYQYPREWDDFEAFLSDVGPKPSPKHQLRRLNSDLPYSKENVTWLAPLPGSRNSQSPEERAEYLRSWQLRRHYKISIPEYEATLVAQNGVCAICQLPERGINWRTGKPKPLSVDHNHKTASNRALLCSHCNQGIGMFGESVDLLRRAIEYIETHAP